MKKISKELISEETALNELLAFVNHHSLIEKTIEEIKEDMHVTLLAIQNGSLLINDDFIPTLILREPIKNDDGDIVMDKVEFLTRIYPRDHIKLSKGLNVSKDQMEYMQRCIAHLSKLPVTGYLNKFSKFDYTVMQQLSTVFM